MTPCPYRFPKGWHCCLLAGHSGNHLPAAADFLTPPASPAAIVEGGYAFVFLYYKMPTFEAHVQAHLAAGLGVVPTFETTATRALSGSAGGSADGAACAAQSKAIGQTPGTAVAFNIADFKPTAPQIPALFAYLQAFDAALGNFAPAPYVTQFALDQLVKLGASPSFGWWQNAESDGGENTSGGDVDANAAYLQRTAPVLTIPGAAAGWDEDVILRTVPVWGLSTPAPSPAPAPTPAPTTVGGDVQVTTVPIATDANGNGWTLTEIPWASFVAVSGQGSYPPVDGYWAARVTAQERTEKVCVTVMDAPASSTVDVFVAAGS